MDKVFFPKSRIATIVGHYGSGKSELAINIALLFAAMKKTGEGFSDSAPFCLDDSEEEKLPVCLADLDVVNPYFRSREVSKYLNSMGIKVIASAEDFPNVDLPYMPESMSSIFQNQDVFAVIDAGGDPAGARVLARYSNDLKKYNADIYFILNANRPFTKTAVDTIKCIHDIEGAANLKITGIINNTHLMGDTEVEDIIMGAKLSETVSEETGIPIVAHAVRKDLLCPNSHQDMCLFDAGSIELDAENELVKELGDKILPIDIFLKKPWEQ